MSKSLQKFQTFLSQKNITIRHIVCNNDSIEFLIVFAEDLHEYMIVTINNEYKMTRKDIDISIDVINTQSHSFSSNEKEEKYTLDYSVNQIDEDMRDDTQVIKDGLSMSNYKEINISKTNKVDNLQYKQHTQQLEKFKECVKNLRYKFSIFSQDYVTLIDRSNNIKNYIIKNKENYIPTDTIVLCICIDLENLFENIDTMVEDSIKLYSSFYNILNDAHKKQILALDSQIKLITDVPKQIENKKNDLSKIQVYLNNILQNLFKLYKEENKLIKLKEFEERKKAVEQKEVRTREATIDRITSELSKITDQKEKYQATLSNIRKSYHQQLLSFDFNVYKGLQLFYSMSENIKKVL